MSHLTLKHFILRQQVLNLYRQAFRACRVIPDLNTRRETLGWIRAEFERNKHLSDVTDIEEKLKIARRELKQMLPWTR
ncbi:complex 1 protein-domain-containing protein [Lentinula raphanica]|uniref:LYR motif-containing protein 2 n=1 Tax=Lentinula raphanica TaxID=153919 RepID=A0AA38PKC5_9AGAR|nr:complex 1 protein-domain-containing protein [Lentinula raphanica]KAJ3776926.1 complex 1 protein-domain-containing protein [Lentinula raphanica]KAJ3825739.1 complex 1 protein-domain-containing protein [Lentinula raphanica]KAJ3844086.1 complex 1 protein-domain-containing protein [Lentinula raphanica]